MSSQNSNYLNSNGLPVWFIGASFGFIVRLVVSNLTNSSLPSERSGGIGEFFDDENDYYVKQEEVDEYTKQTVKFSVVIIIIMLILLTIGFETAKHRVFESVDKVMKPMIDSMFREMTILGFLSMVTFLITKFGFVSSLSSKFFGESDFLLEIFELVHYTIFFVMVFFINQVLLCAKETMMTQALWIKMDKDFRRDGFMENLVKKMKDSGLSCEHTIDDIFKKTGKIKILNRGWGSKVTLEDELSFYALREEFIKDRSPTTFLPVSEDSRVPADFNYGRYLGLCLAKMLKRIVDIKHETWYFFIVSTIIFYVIEALTNNSEIIAWSWVFLGYLFLTFQRFFDRSLNHIVKAFVSLEGTHLLELLKKEEIIVNFESDEVENLIENESNEVLNGSIEKFRLPKWCHIDLDSYKKNRSIIMKLSKKEHNKNRKYLVYLFEEYGPKIYLIMFQVILVFIGIYCALLLVHFLPVIKQEHGTVFFLLYTFIAFFPVFAMVTNQRNLLITLTQCCSIGSHRWLQVISTVSREAKTQQLVHTLVMLHEWQRLATGEHVKRDIRRRTTVSKLDMNHVQGIFDNFDEDGSGILEAEEIKGIMKYVGLKLSNESIESIINTLSKNGNGEVLEEEFLQWYADYMFDDSVTLPQRAQFLFDIFDKDQNGHITIGEFKEQLDSMSIGFTIDEIGQLVQEIDEDGDGIVSYKEFVRLLKKFF